MDILDRIFLKLCEILEGSRASPIYMVTTCMEEEKYNEYKKSGTTNIFLGPRTLSESLMTFGNLNHPFPIIEKFDPTPFSEHIDFSRRCEFAFTQGDKEAIFDFCTLDEWAFRERWVVNQIESWLKENTRDSKKKLRCLMQKYSEARGKKLRDDEQKLMQRNVALYNEVSMDIEKHPIFSIEGSAGKVLEKEKWRGENIDAKTVQKIYRRMKKIEKLIADIVSDFRENIGFFYNRVPTFEEIDPLVRNLFNFGESVRSVHKEYELYREMRYLYKRIVYRKDFGLIRVPGLQRNKKVNELTDIIKKISKREGISQVEVKAFYLKLRKLEEKQNSGIFAKNYRRD